MFKIHQSLGITKIQSQLIDRCYRYASISKVIDIQFCGDSGKFSIFSYDVQF